jgi:DNA transformation protein and related proteins
MRASGLESTPARPNQFVSFVVEQLRRWSPVSARRLFGGQGLYRGERIFAVIMRDTLYFRTDDINRPDFEAAGMAPLRVGKGNSARIALSYHEVPPDILEEPEELARWAEHAFAAATRRADAKNTPTKKPRGNRKPARPLKRRKD